MRVALYCRVSKKRVQTTENQKIILKKYADRMGWVYDIYEEQESTRKTRPVKAYLLDKLRHMEYDAVCVLRLDRWARSISELVMEVKELFERGVIFISVKENIDLSTAVGKLYFHIIAAFADFEREITRERTLEGLARAKAQGKHIGRPFGSKDSYKRKRSGYHLRHAGDKIKKKYLEIEAKQGVDKSQGRIIDEIVSKA
jgi:DNA invertase Pin-like site-specific DNA recombinase